MTRKEPVQIVALNGSPHRQGNTATLMQWVLEGCAEAGAHVEWIHLIDHDVQYCQGCNTCLRTGVCPIEDDLLTLRGRLLAADGIVVGSPVYADRPTAQLKTLMDRLTLLNLYTDTFHRQRTVGVATSGIAPTRGVAREIATFFGRRQGIIGSTTASISRGYEPLAERPNPRLRVRARALGRSLVTRIQSTSRVRLPSLTQIYFNMLRRLALRPLLTRHADLFAGVLQIWKEKGWLSAQWEQGRGQG